MAKFHSEQTHRTIDRVRSAESKTKALKAENAELRKQLFRAQESARLANEETTARIAAQRQSSEALRAQLSTARADAARWEATAEKAWKWNRELRDQPLHLIAAQRIAARFGRSA